MAKATTSSSVSTPPYDIRPDDIRPGVLNHGQNCDVPVDGMRTGESFSRSLNEVQAPSTPYPLPFPYSNNLSYFKSPQVGLTPPFPTFPTNRATYNLAPPSHSQAQPSFSTLSPNPGPSTSLQGALTHSLASVPARKTLHKANPKEKGKGKRATRNVTQSAKRDLLIANSKRKRTPIKRPPGTSFSELLDGLSHEVRTALQDVYQGCCESINAKDTATKHKHWFTDRHCNNLPKEYQEAVPNFLCPAFLAFSSKCRAKAGRYDSAERHCQGCPGFKEISSGQNEAFPVVITRSGYRNIQTLRMALKEMENKGDGEATELAVDSARRMLAALFKNGLPIIDYEEALGEASGSGAIEDHNCDNTQPTAQPLAPPTGTGVTSEPVFDPEIPGWDCRWDASLEINCEGESSSSQAGGIMPVDSDHTTPTPEPIFELDLGNVKWDDYGNLVFF